MTIEDLKALDLDKVTYPSIKAAAVSIIDDYEGEKEKDKAEFLKQVQENIDSLYKMIKVKSPEALPENQDKQNVSADTAKDTPKKKKLTKKEMDAFEEEIKQCRIAIKEYNAKKREGKPKKPALKRHEKIEKNLLAIGNLVPDNLKDNLDILEKAEKILSKTGREIMKLYRMDALEIKEVQEEIKEKYEKKEEKINKDNDE